MSDYGLHIFPQHAGLLAASAIEPEVSRERGYVSVDTATRLVPAGFAKSQRNVPGLLIPIWGTDGTLRVSQYRPDNPRIDKTGKPRKYETPYRQSICLDVPRRIREQLADAAIPLWITEGARKADAAVSAGACCIALIGVDGWMREGQALPDWLDIKMAGRQVVVAFDSDIMTKPSVAKALARLTGFLTYRGADVRHAILPDLDGLSKTGLDDYLAAGHTLADVELVQPGAATQTPRQEPLSVSAPFGAPLPFNTPTDISGCLSNTRATYRRWLGFDYDLGVLDVVLSAAACGKLDGDPVWLLVVGGSGWAKTETIVALAGANAVLASTISGEAGLLSGTSEKDRAKDATGGLLRKLGDRGVLVIKDFTSILSMNRDTRALVLAALREIYDGHWNRNVGTDGGQTIGWDGRIVLIGACTTAWDSAHQVIATMGDRFLLARFASGDNRSEAAAQAIDNVGHENTMRAELAAVVAKLMAAVDPDGTYEVEDADRKTLIAAADIVTRARTAVERDFKGNPSWAHALEAPTRAAKELMQIVRGALAIGMDTEAALAAAMRAAHDSMPPLRAQVLGHVAAHPRASLAEAVKALQLPRTTVDKTLQELHLLGLAEIDAVEETTTLGVRTRWLYTIAPHIDAGALAELTGNVSGGVKGQRCTVCGEPLAQTLIDAGFTDHGEEASQ